MKAIPKPENPRPNLSRADWQNLNGEWEFALFPAGSEARETAFAAARESYPQSILVPFSWSAPASGVGQDTPGTGWYRRRARFEARGRVFLCVGAADYRCDLFVNGCHVCRHEGGYTPFEADVTPWWRTGENVIEARVQDDRRKCQTTGKQLYAQIDGIWQTVWLEARPAAHLKNLWFETQTDGAVTLCAAAHSPRAQSARLTARFAGREWAADAALSAGETRLRLAFRLPEPRLWSPEEPFLYEGTVALEADGERDEAQTYFGVREVGFAAFGGREYPWLTLNGAPCYWRGTLDQAVYPDSGFTAPSDAWLRAEVERLKALGLNLVREHIKPEEPRKLYWMDKLGVMVQEDMPCFWGDPDEEARAAYGREWREVMARDCCHPCVVSWVMFNETWGLFTDSAGYKIYLPQTREWVKSVFRAAKEEDPTRLVEDNSATNWDHLETDLNSWHFYINGYGLLRDHLRLVDGQTFPGSPFNFVGGAVQGATPLLNSECGAVWGVDGSAGDSDLSWQYRYMMNEFRLHEKICGFIFTEFKDVVNEFNGYYRMNGAEKDWGYGGLCPGMTLRDLHAADFPALDAPPCRTVAAGETVRVPVCVSRFGKERRAEGMTLEWQLCREGLEGRVTCCEGRLETGPLGWGLTAIGEIEATMPERDAVALLCVCLRGARGGAVSRNFIAFDVRGGGEESPLPPAEGCTFPHAWRALEGQKCCFGGSGEVRFTLPARRGARGPAELVFEAGAKRVLTRDLETGRDRDPLAFFNDPASIVDKGAFANSYFMTDGDAFPSRAEVRINGRPAGTVELPNDPADCRGVLSWHAQRNDRRLEEAGSYGYLCRVAVPEEALDEMAREGKAEVTFRVTGGGGLALYGRHCGRYALGMGFRYASGAIENI